MKTKNNWRYVIVGVAAAAVMSIGGLSLAEESSPPDKDCMHKQSGSHYSVGHGRGGLPIGHLAEALELTEEQKQTLAVRKSERRDASLAQRKQLHQARKALDKAVTGNASEAEISRLAKQVGDLTALQLVTRAREQQFLLGMLTEEQKEKMAHLRVQRKSHKHKHAADSRTR